MKKLVLFFAVISFSYALLAQSEKSENLKWKLINNTLNISGHGDMPSYVSYSEDGSHTITNAESWYNEQIEKVIIQAGITSIGEGAFANYRNLKTVIIPNTVTNIGKYAFMSCSNLQSVFIPNSVTKIGKFAFYECKQLLTITMSNSVTDIESQAFMNCRNLSSILISNNVTNIGEYAFQNCVKLNSITIPYTVTNIGEYAFAGCSELLDIYVNWRSPLDISSKSVFSNIPASATIHVPSDTKSLYQRAAGWKKFNIEEKTLLAIKKQEMIFKPESSGKEIISKQDLPEIEWLLPAHSNTNVKELGITACIKSKTKIEQVNILVNGQKYRGVNAVINDGCDYTVNQSINLVGGSNVIILHVENADGIKKVERIVNYAPSAHVSMNKRYALIMGNASYKTDQLNNPVHDATDVEAKLKQLGFTTVLVKDATKEKMEYVIRDIAFKAQLYDAVLFFYSGHAIQYEGKNYLIPIDANLQTPSDINYCISMDLVLGKMEDAQCKMKIVVLDACRNNPFPSWTRGSKGKGLVGMDAPSGTFIAYSAAGGKVAHDGKGRNSPYTEEFLYMLDVPKLNILDFFQEIGDRVRLKTNESQTPWIESSFRGKFYFNDK